MPWKKGHTKPMAKAAVTGPRNSQNQRRRGFLKMLFKRSAPFSQQGQGFIRIPDRKQTKLCGTEPRRTRRTVQSIMAIYGQGAQRRLAQFRPQRLPCYYCISVLQSGADEHVRPAVYWVLVLLSCDQPLAAWYWTAQPSTNAVLTCSQLASLWSAL